jgi:hypothetical protein
MIMQPWELIFLVPIIAIVFGVGGETVKQWLRSRERQLELRLQMAQEQNNKAGKADGSVMAEVAALRAELASLRDTSTQYDISIEHTMQRIEQRVGRLETKSAVVPVKAPEEEPQRLGTR